MFVIKSPRWPRIVVLGWLLILAGCASADDRPEPEPRATRPLAVPATQTSMPPAIVSGPTTAPPGAPEVDAGHTATATTLASPTLTPTTVPFRIDRPVTGSVLIAGDSLTINGWSQPANGDVLFSIQIGQQEILAGQVGVDRIGMWGGLFTLPEKVTGLGTLTATSAAGETTSVDVEIVVDLELEGPMITLTRPAPGDAVAIGHIVFFEGVIRDPISEAMSFSISTGNCTSPAAHFTMAMSSGVWWGQLVLPENTSTGPACAIASTGQVSESDSDWREVRIPITLMEPDDPDVTRLFLGNPGELRFRSGSRIRLYGGAVNAPENQVRLVLAQDVVGPGDLLSEAAASIEAFGYWEADMALPAGWFGPALLTISTGTDDSYIELRAVAEIER